MKTPANLALAMIAAEYFPSANANTIRAGIVAVRSAFLNLGDDSLIPISDVRFSYDHNAAISALKLIGAI